MPQTYLRASDVTGLPMSAAYRRLSAMEESRPLTDILGGQRDRKYTFHRYLNLFTS